MKTMKQYVVDAFTDKVFAGNPAAVCLMDEWLPDETLQKLAVENSLSETAFAVKETESLHLRWFTPGGEIELCGHATLAAAFVILRITEPALDAVSFRTLSGVLTVRKDGELLTMDFPAFKLAPVPVTDEMEAAVGVRPLRAYKGADTVLVLPNEAAVRAVRPDLGIISRFEGPCFHITAKGDDYDCVTRTFAPRCGVPEDPVCGRGHCHVVPFWAKELGRDTIRAWQASPRGGALYCRAAGDRVFLGGKAALFSETVIHFD